MSGQWTKGPWEVCTHPRYFPHVHIGPKRKYGDHCTAYVTINEGPSNEAIAKYEATGDANHIVGTESETNLANAHLISAAPDMAEALEALLEQFDAYRDGWLTGNSGDWRNRIGLLEDIAKARAALSKAKGEKNG